MQKNIVILLFLLILSSCAKDDREKLVIYSPHGKELLSAYEDAFEAQYPEVDVQWLDMGSQGVYDRIATERQRPQASLWWGAPSPLFARAAREDLLEPYRPSWHAQVAETMHDPDDLWYGVYQTPEVIAFNNRTLPEAEWPANWDDMLDPKWHDRIIIRYPLQSGTMRTIFGAMILRQPSVEEGFVWLARLDCNTKTYAADPTQLYLKIAREEGDVTLWNMPDIELQSQQNGYPFGFIIPAAGTPVLTEGLALVKGGPNLERAKQFYEFITTLEAFVRQAHDFHRIPTRADVDTAELPDWMTRTNITEMPLDWAKLTQHEAEWMQYWDENIKGRGEAYLRERNLPITP